MTVIVAGRCRAFTVGLFEPQLIRTIRVSGIRVVGRVSMKAPIWILLTAVVLVATGSLAIMNNACKSSHHTWCAPSSDIRHHAKI
jgi:hypothetical protein